MVGDEEVAVCAERQTAARWDDVDDNDDEEEEGEKEEEEE